MSNTSVKKTLAQEGGRGRVWSARPFQLVSLLDMIEFRAEIYFAIAVRIEKAAGMALVSKASGIREVKDDLKKSVSEEVRAIASHCKKIELMFSASHAERILNAMKDKYTFEQLHHDMNELQLRVIDEMKGSIFLHIPVHETKFYTDNPQFGEIVANRFSKAVTDIQEAGKCFAVGRYTACVFHLMRVMEIGVQYLGKKLRVSGPEEKEWQKIMDEVNGAMRRMNTPPRRMTPKMKARRDIYAAVVAHLTNVKNAWRNRVMHPKDTYTGEEAERIYNNVKDFMVYLATKL